MAEISDKEIVDKLISNMKPANAHAEIIMREHLFNMVWLVRRCQDCGLTDAQILQLVLGEEEQP